VQIKERSLEQSGHSMEKERKNLVNKLIRDGRISKPEVIEAMLSVPRELFIPPVNRANSYVDAPQSIGEGQTISAPHMVGIMVEAMDLRPGQKVLEIGGGSGYHAAVVAKLIEPNGRIFSVETIGQLSRMALSNLKRAGIQSVTMINADGSVGLAAHAPYDRIFVACAAPSIPPPLIEQLKEDGILLIPVGSTYYSDLMRCSKVRGKLKKENLGGCAFVPLTGEYGI